MGFGQTRALLFLKFQAWGGFGSAKFALDGPFSEYLCTYGNLQEFLLAMCEPQVFGLQAVSGRVWLGRLRLGLDIWSAGMT